MQTVEFWLFVLGLAVLLRDWEWRQEQLRKDFQWKFERNGNPGED